jgi:hypothetical protein
MAQNLIRARQINQADLTGVLQNVINANEFSLNYNGGTGFNIDSVSSINISGTSINIYDTPIKITSDFNLSGLGYFANNLNLNNIDSVVFSGVDINVIRGTISADNIIYNTGTQTVSGNVVVASGIYAQYVYANNLVYNTGNQTISGVKTFANRINASGIVGGVLLISGDDFNIKGGNYVAIEANDAIVLSAPNQVVLNTYYNGNDINDFIGIQINSKSIDFRGTGVFWSGIDLKNNKLNNASNIVYNTGNQTISGVKTFVSSGIFSLSGALASGLPNNPLSVVGSGNSYLQLNIQNRATGVTASADLVITANNGTDNTNFINLGINNVGYNDPLYNNATGLDGYLFIDGGDLDIGTRTPGKIIEFHAGGTTEANVIARISQTGLNIVSGNLTVGGTGVILSGSTPFVMNFGHIKNNTTAGLQYYYFGPQMDIDPVSVTNNEKRRGQILQDCYLRKLVWTSIAKMNPPIPNNAITGYFKNFGNNPLTDDQGAGTQITSAISIPGSNTMYSISTGNLNIPVKSGDYLSFYYETNFTAGSNNLASGLAVNVDAYFYV